MTAVPIIPAPPVTRILELKGVPCAGSGEISAQSGRSALIALVLIALVLGWRWRRLAGIAFVGLAGPRHRLRPQPQGTRQQRLQASRPPAGFHRRRGRARPGEGIGCRPELGRQRGE